MENGRVWFFIAFEFFKQDKVPMSVYLFVELKCFK